MFISKEEVQARSGKVVDGETLTLAQTMIETWVGKDDAEVTKGSDRAVLAKATMFQVIYLAENPDTVLVQAGVKQLSQNESNIKFDTDMFSPFMSPWAVVACKKLSWFGTRSVKTGPMSSYSGLSWKKAWYTE